MPFDMGASIGDLSGWGGGVAQATEKVSNLAPHVDGGQSSTAHTVAGASPDTKRILHVACGIVLAALLLLWLNGALVFRSANL